MGELRYVRVSKDRIYDQIEERYFVPEECIEEAAQIALEGGATGRVVRGIRALAGRREHFGGSLHNYLAQSAQAAEQIIEETKRLLAAGYREVAPGILRSPDGAVEVDL